jgi:6,7-dimethyl-8-ribityllumazine synthase
MKFRKGTHDATGLRFGIVVSKFNKFVTSRLLAAAVEALKKAGAVDEALEVVRVPGAFEIPLAVAQAIERADPAKHNRGADAARTAIEMVTVLRDVQSKPARSRSGRSSISNTPKKKTGTRQ